MHPVELRRRDALMAPIYDVLLRGRIRVKDFPREGIDALLRWLGLLVPLMEGTRSRFIVAAVG